MSLQDILAQFHAAAHDPAGQMKRYIAAGEQVVLTAPVYTPEELIHAMGLVPMGAWGADLPLEGAKEYFPAFLCSIVQSILELGMKGAYEGASAIVIPSLCDSLKCLGQNWKAAVPGIPFVPMTYPQNRRGEVGKAFAKAGYERVARDLERLTGRRLTPDALSRSIRAYNAHNAAMRRLDGALCAHPEVSAAQRSDIYKSAWFMRKEEHTALVEGLLAALVEETPACSVIPASPRHSERSEESVLPSSVPPSPIPQKYKIMTTGILCDSPSLLEVFDELGFQIGADDVAAESRQYRTDAPEEGDPLDALAEKFAKMDLCSVLYDPEKKRPDHIVQTAQARGAKGVVAVLTKFCDPEEFDWPLIKKACEKEGIPVVLVEVDRQMNRLGQVRTALETFRDMIGQEE